jgi:hypothetical protein
MKRHHKHEIYVDHAANESSSQEDEYGPEQKHKLVEAKEEACLQLFEHFPYKNRAFAD